jgi:hypothetical protein
MVMAAIIHTTRPYGTYPTYPIRRNAPRRQIEEKIARAIQGALSVMPHRRSSREPTQYQRRRTKGSERAADTISGNPGHLSPIGHNTSDPTRKAGMFDTTANL